MCKGFIDFGFTTLWTPPFEVRTKPSEWVAIHNLPELLLLEGFKEELQRADGSLSIKRTIVHRDGVGFAQLDSRAQAIGLCVQMEKLFERKATGIVISLLPSLNRLLADDSSLQQVALPNTDGNVALARQSSSLWVHSCFTSGGFHSSYSPSSPHSDDRSTMSTGSKRSYSEEEVSAKRRRVIPVTSAQEYGSHDVILPVEPVSTEPVSDKTVEETKEEEVIRVEPLPSKQYPEVDLNLSDSLFDRDLMYPELMRSSTPLSCCENEGRGQDVGFDCDLPDFDYLPPLGDCFMDGFNASNDFMDL